MKNEKQSLQRDKQCSKSRQRHLPNEEWFRTNALGKWSATWLSIVSSPNINKHNHHSTARRYCTEWRGVSTQHDGTAREKINTPTRERTESNKKKRAADEAPSSEVRRSQRQKHTPNYRLLDDPWADEPDEMSETDQTANMTSAESVCAASSDSNSILIRRNVIWLAFN